MSKQIKEDAEDVFSDLETKSLKASLDAGLILPQLKPRLNQVYEVKVLSEPRSFEGTYGIAFSIDIESEGMEKSLILPKSFRFQLKVAMMRKQLKYFKDLIGKTLLFQKIEGSTKKFKNAELYTVQIKD